MLGSTLTKFLSNTNHKVIESNTTGKAVVFGNQSIKFDIESQEVTEAFGTISKEIDFILNCSGLIKHKINESDPLSVASAYKVNVEFPKKLSEFFLFFKTRIIQIATDCVFSGSVGNYDEESIHDATDVYGTSKSQGEIAAENLMILRCSVIGKEIQSHVEFMDWILGQPANSKLHGFTNHYWNGLTTYHFAKIVYGIIESNSFKSGVHHVLPRDAVSKFELIGLICKSFAREDIQIEAFESENFVDRRLGTKFPTVNDEFWKLAGYDGPLSIQQMIAEYSNWTRAE